MCVTQQNSVVECRPDSKSADHRVWCEIWNVSTKAKKLIFATAKFELTKTFSSYFRWVVTMLAKLNKVEHKTKFKKNYSNILCQLRACKMQGLVLKQNCRNKRETKVTLQRTIFVKEVLTTMQTTNKSREPNRANTCLKQRKNLINNKATPCTAHPI